VVVVQLKKYNRKRIKANNQTDLKQAEVRLVSRGWMLPAKSRSCHNDKIVTLARTANVDLDHVISRRQRQVNLEGVKWHNYYTVVRTARRELTNSILFATATGKLMLYPKWVSFILNLHFNLYICH